MAYSCCCPSLQVRSPAPRPGGTKEYVMPQPSRLAPQRLEGEEVADGFWSRSTERQGDTRVLLVSQADLESVAALFGRITALRRRCSERTTVEEESDEGAPLDAHVRVVMRVMKERLASLEETPLQEAEVIMAKHGLYSICFQEVISVADAINPGLSCALEDLRDAHHDLLQSVPRVVRRAIDEYQQEISRLRADKEREGKEARELVEAAQALERETVGHHQEVKQLNLRLKQLEEENASLRGGDSVKDPLLLTMPQPPLHKALNNGFVGVATTSERKPPLAVADLSTTLCDDGTGRLGADLSSEPPSKNVRREGTAWDRSGAEEYADGHGGVAVGVDTHRELSLKQLHDFIASVYASKEKYDRLCITQRLPNHTMARHLDDFLVHRHGLTSMARIQKSALRKGFERFRDNDNAVKVFEMTIRNEVDERFRHEQIGLQRMVSELIRARIRERTAHHDKTFKHDDRYCYRRLGGTSISRVAAGGLGTVSVSTQQGVGLGADRAQHFAAGSAPASAATIESLLRNQTRPGALLAVDDWHAVVHHVFKESRTADAATVKFLVKEAAWNMRQGGKDEDQPGPGRRRGAGAELRKGQCSVPFGMFLQVLLGYQLHGYLRRIEAFKEDFREVDVDGDGILNPVQFLALAKRTLGRGYKTKTSSQQWRNPRRNENSCSSVAQESRWQRGSQATAVGKGRRNRVQQQAAARLRAVDPHGFGVITFSQCVLNLVISNP